MLDRIKLSLRIKNNAFDSEIKDLIDAAKMDLKIAGVEKIEIDDEEEKLIIVDPLIVRAITMYVKANFGWDNPDSEKLQQAYLMLKQHLALSGDYNVI